ncbi:hypothetical protein [Actinomadura verrucosospora]|uniref:Uncharacterized protein n=1 Tax=Actinomadura verrucosospora TaxID=46165 RepID=A0A7D3VZG9_ACTVE|nr:hypothetical protein [Actinomadura verrucosospora]QKG27553.1 hypothetical protein ACTIVE_9208 [Actinomadura verrucosospora]
MKPTRPRRRGPRRTRSVWGRIAGYGGAALLVAAAVVVLLVPLLDKHEGGSGAVGAESPGASPTAGQGTVPGASGQPVTPSNPVPQTGGATPYPGGGEGGGGMQIPSQNGAGGTGWCPQGTAFYRAAAGSVDVTITVSSSGAIRAELSIKGHAPQAQQTTVSGGRPHTFRFKRVPAQLVQRVKVTTVSVGVAMQNCYARPA